MLEITGNLWDQQKADAICVTTNGSVRKDGKTDRKPSWNQVKPVLEDILDNRFCIVSNLSQKGKTSCT